MPLPPKLLVVGAGGRVGQRVVREALLRGHTVRALMRDREAVSFSPTVVSVAGDATSAASVADAAEGSAVVVSTVRADDEAAVARSLVEGCGAAGVERLLVVGSALDPVALEVLRRTPESLSWTLVTAAARLEPGTRTGRFVVGGPELLSDQAAPVSMEDLAVALLGEVAEAAFPCAHLVVASTT